MEKAAEQTFAITGHQAIRTIASEMTEELELTALLNLLVQRALVLIDIAEMGVIYLWDEATQTLVPQAWHNIGAWIREVRLKPGEGMAGVVVQRRQGLAVDAYKQAPYAFPPFTERLEQAAVIAEPLLYGARLIGVISISATAPGRSFTLRDREILAWFASHAAITIVNAQLCAEAQVQAAELAEANAALQRGMKERQRADELFRIAVESAPNAMVMVNHAGRIELVNSQTEVLFGYHRDELLGQPVEILVPERFRQQHPAERTRFMEAPTVRAMGVGRDLYGLRKDGSEFPVEIGLNPIQTDEGLFVLSAVIDITERKRIEEQLQHYIAELEQSNKELDSFAYIASHDLKAPLRAIDNLAQWIAEDAEEVLPADSQRHLQTLRQRVRRLEGLLDDLLGYSRAGQEQVPSEVVDTGVLVAGIVEMLAPPPTFTMTVAPHMPTLRTSKSPLEQVFRNLIGNAIKHHHRPDGRVEVTAHDCGRLWEFVVADDGPGIPAAYHDRIFQMFQALKPRDDVEGSGIGLAMVRKLVAGHGGTITVESTEGQGARFRFTWPKQALNHE